MSRQPLIALAVLPALIAGSGQALASDYCAALGARLAQMPEVIGSTQSSHARAETEFRLNRLEIAIRRDMRNLGCPTSSIIVWNAENGMACAELDQELANVREEKQSVADLQPVLGQTVDDGSGLLPAILNEMRRAGCNLSGSQQDVEIIGSGSRRNSSIQQISTRAVAIENPDSEAVNREDLAAAIGDQSEGDYGVPESFGMIELRPGDNVIDDEGKVATVAPPKLEGEDAAKPAPKKQASIPLPSIPDRPYDPKAPGVRKVGPSFLAEDEGTLDLRHPADSAAN